MNCRQILVLAVTTCLSAGRVWAEPAAHPMGMWLDESGRAGIAIAPCGSKLCGTITWLKTPLDPQGRPKRDVHNADPAMRDRQICGLRMLSGFAADGAKSWTGGTIYDPQRGKAYSSTLRLEQGGTLRVRGYVGIPLFGRSETWTRPIAALPHCGGA